MLTINLHVGYFNISDLQWVCLGSPQNQPNVWHNPFIGPPTPRCIPNPPQALKHLDCFDDTSTMITCLTCSIVQYSSLLQPPNEIHQRIILKLQVSTLQDTSIIDHQLHIGRLMIMIQVEQHCIYALIVGIIVMDRWRILSMEVL